MELTPFKLTTSVFAGAKTLSAVANLALAGPVIRPNRGVLGREFVTSDAVRLRAIEHVRGVRSGLVFSQGARMQVFRIHAGAITTTMVKRQPLRNQANQLLVCDAVSNGGLFHPAAVGEAITVFGFPALPFPTSAVVLSNLRPELFAPRAC
jgi:hypothetical protein